MDILSNKILCYINKKIKLEDIEIYRYGIEIIMSDLSNFLIIIIPSLFLHKFLEGCLFLITFVGIRRYSGGFHCSTCFRCNMSFLLLFLMSLFSYKIPKIFMIIMFCISFLTLLYNSIFNSTIAIKKKIKSILYLSLIPLCTYLFLPNLFSIVEFTVVLVCFLLLVKEVK